MLTTKYTLFLLFAIISLGGCSLHPDWPGPEDAASHAVGVQDAIRISAETGLADRPGEPPQTLSLAQAIRQGLETSPDIQASLAGVKQAYAEAQQARLLPNPVVSIALRVPQESADPLVVEAGITGELLSLLQKPGRVSAADHRLRAASAEAVTTVLDVLTELQQTYIAAQSLDALMPVLKERRKLIDRLLNIARSRLKAGEGTRLDVATLETQRVELEVEIAERELERRGLRLALAKLIGRPSDPAQWSLEAWQLPENPVPDESVWIATALEHRPEIQARVWELAALGQEVRLSRLALFEGTELGAVAERDAGDWSVGPEFSVPIPLMDWGQARRANAQASQLKANHELTRTGRQVVEEVRRAFLSFSVSLDAYRKVRDELLPLLEQRQKDAEAAYRVGESDIIALVLADQDLQAGRTKLIELERKTSESLARLHRAAGGPGRTPQAVSVYPTPVGSSECHTPRP